jgi:hypothetical protein
VRAGTEQAAGMLGGQLFGPGGNTTPEYWIDGFRTRAAAKAPQRKRPCRSRASARRSLLPPSLRFAALLAGHSVAVAQNRMQRCKLGSGGTIQSLANRPIFSSAPGRHLWGRKLWHMVFSELYLPCLACRLSQFFTMRHRPNSGQPVRGHGYIAARSESAKGGTRPVCELVAGL